MQNTKTTNKRRQQKVKVLVVDDSALIRKMLTEILNSDPDLDVVGTAADPLMARQKIKTLQPDVLTLDVEMPRMNGLSFLENLMRLRPMPVVMISSLTKKGADVTQRALELGAVDFIPKPQQDISRSLMQYSDSIIAIIKSAASAKVKPLRGKAPSMVIAPKLNADAILKYFKPRRYHQTDKIVAIGASTGGTEAIKDVLSTLPEDFPGTVVAQHIPVEFSASFAESVNQVSKMHVQQAEDGDAILPGHVYIAPGDRHLLIERNGSHYTCRLNNGPRVNRHKPSVDVMFRSVAQQAGPNATGVILTGMGADGALGLKEMRDAGAHTMAQDEASSMVWGMPGEAYRMGAAAQVLSLKLMAEAMMKASLDRLSNRANSIRPKQKT